MAANSYPTLAGQLCSDPGVLIEFAREQNLKTDFWGLATSYVCPRGKETGRAWVLLPRRTVNALSTRSEIELHFRSPQSDVRIRKLRFVRATCMSAGPTPGDVEATYLVELADKRRWLAMTSMNKQYNVRVPAPPATSGTTAYHSESLNAGSLWTWATMLADLWALLPSSIRGTAPTLPYTPDAPCEGWRFIGASVWDAIHQILEKVSCTTVYNPTTDAFSIVRTGTTQSNLTETINGLNARRLDDLSPVVENSAILPEKIKVLFRKLHAFKGAEPISRATDNLAMEPVHEEDKATSITGAIAGTFLTLWDDLPAITDDTGAVTNTAAINTRATEVADNYVNTIKKLGAHSHYIFGGALGTIMPGSEVERVIWRDYGDDVGLVTEVINRAVDLPAGMLDRQLNANEDTVLLGKNETGSTIGPDDDGDITVYKGTAGSEATAGYDINAYNKTSVDVEDDAWVALALINGQWYMTPWTCPS